MKKLLAISLLVSFFFPIYYASAFFFAGNVMTTYANSSFEPTTKLTMMAWAKATTTIVSNTWFDATSSSPGNNVLDTFVRYQGAAASNKDVRCQVATSTSTTLNGPAGSINAFAWTLYWITYDGVTIKCGHNATQDVSAPGAGTLGTFYRYAIGGGFVGANTTQPPAQGNVTDLFVFNRDLTLGEIRNYYYFGNLNHSGCVHWWPLYIDGTDFCGLGGQANATTSAVNINFSLVPYRSPFRR